ncbi:MAG TPA: hypothetical protein VNA87_01000 [Actinomycetota bacterium]|nr:hypothetical protein [Actinomycetota bacterium]
MKRSVKQVFKVLMLSGGLGVIGGLLSPPRLKGTTGEDTDKDTTGEDKGVSLLPDPEVVTAEVPEADPVPDVPAPKAATPKKRPAAPSKSKTAAVSKPKASSTARIPKTAKPRPVKPKDQSGGSEK